MDLDLSNLQGSVQDDPASGQIKDHEGAVGQIIKNDEVTTVEN